MRVTRFPQSCLVVDVGDARIAIDPGSVVSANYALDDLGRLDAVLYTHRHPDHLDPQWARLLDERGVALYGNADVRALLVEEAEEPSRVTEVRPGSAFHVNGIEVCPHAVPHVELIDGTPGPANTGYVIDGTLLHPGDGVTVDALQVPVVAAPIAGPSISFRDAYRLVQAVNAQAVLPIHHDVFLADPALFARLCDVADVILAENATSVDLSSS